MVDRMWSDFAAEPAEPVTHPGFVELQLLRHGPPHNQLLSPLTEYLALCGDHPNTTLRIPLEHAALETRLRAMRYLDSEDTRVDQLRETARIASELLAKVPGLIADLSSNRAEDRPFVHLSIASRASELALFPFELAVAPDGFPGAGQFLCLQNRLPVCLTRRSRNVRNDDFIWHRPIKILMVASDAAGEIPVQQHYAMLRKLVEPWVAPLPSDDVGARRRKTRKVLKLLTRADAKRIASVICEEVFATGEPFTHIHVLAHGCDLPESDRRSGIAFYRPHGDAGVDAVDGRRLAKALGCLPDFPASANYMQGPTVVTLATCGSADQGAVAIPGASVAFELHDSGIPLVVGSQFPLTFEGSLIMTEALYRGFLAGRDPRSTIWEARRKLLAESGESPKNAVDNPRTPHDWASMTAYAAFPGNLDRVLPEHRRNQQRRRMDARLKNTNLLLNRLAPPPPDEPGGAAAAVAPAGVPAAGGPDSKLARDVQSALAHADKAMHKFKEFVDRHDNEGTAAQVINGGILASAQKQVGLLYLRASGLDAEREVDSEMLSKQIRREWGLRGELLLRRSHETYTGIFEASRDQTWALVQSLALEFALGKKLDVNQWKIALQFSLMEQAGSNVKHRIWALTAILELQFLAWFHEEETGEHLDIDHNPVNLANRLWRLVRKDRTERKSAKRQLERYLKEFPVLHVQNHKVHDVEQFESRHSNRTEPSKLATVEQPLNKTRKQIKQVLEPFDALNFREKLTGHADEDVDGD